MRHAGVCPMCGEARLLFIAPMLVANGEDGTERMSYLCKECAWPTTDDEEYMP